MFENESATYDTILYVVDFSIMMLLLCEAMDFSIRFTVVGLVHKSRLLAWTTVLVICASTKPNPK